FCPSTRARRVASWENLDERPHHDWFRARGIGSMTAVPAASCKGSCSFTKAYLGRNDRLTGIGASSTASKRVVSQPASCSDTWLTRKLP
ncbi:hypothetical protein N5P37_003557, partial [Trichoderma harzianum]